MTNGKADLVEQMKKQRFLPITEKTFQLFQSYGSIIDPHDPDELSHLLFYEGEAYFRLGDFKEALSRLTRCLQAPKSKELKYLDAQSYNTLGQVYSYLGQETIAINHWLQCRFLCEDLHFETELSICCLNLGLHYGLLENFDAALKYFDLAADYACSQRVLYFDLKIFCQIFRAIVYCRLENLNAALDIFKSLPADKELYSVPIYAAPILNLKVRLYDILFDEDDLHSSLQQLEHLCSSSQEFLELSIFYFDVCSWLLKKEKRQETFDLLRCLSSCIEKSPLQYLHYLLQQYQISYTRIFCNQEEYLTACSRLIQLQPAYLEEQRCAKLYSLEYVERLRQTKNDSEMYREKSRLDQMTGLLNKYTIQFLIEEDLSTMHQGVQSAMILIDLDHFKQINDTLGHLAGDKFICRTASIIRNYFEDTALCGRIGGDEFLVYISQVSDISYVVLQTEILRQEIFRQTSERNITVTTQASIGIAFSSEYCYDYEGLFLAADSALYRAKTSGRNKVIVAD